MTNEQNPQKISVICDISESVFSHLGDYPLQYDEIQKIIKTWGEGHDLNMDFFQLGEKITKLDNSVSADPATDFTAIPDFISFERPQQILLITDGKATIGKNLNEIKFSQLYPIHTLGVGPVHIDEDIEIQDIILPDLLVNGDTVDLKIRIQSRILESIQTDFQIINETGHQLYHERMKFETGNRLKDLTLKFPADLLNGINLATLSPIRSEVEIENNSFSFRGNLQTSRDDILVISGALSLNSNIILGVLDDIFNADIHHYFRMDHLRWNSEELTIQYPSLKMIVLDDFPIHNQDHQFFQKIVALSNSQQIPVLYMQGPWCNLTVGEMISTAYPDFIPKAQDSMALMDISTKSFWLATSSILLDQFPPQRRSVKWFQSEKSWLSYMDESVLIGNKNRFYMVSLPALAESHFKMSINSNSIICQILQKVLLHAFHGNEGFLSLELDRKSLNQGEIAHLLLTSVKGIDLKDIVVHAINGIDTLQLECIEEVWGEEIRCSTDMLIPGEHTFYAEALLPNGGHIHSNTKSAMVQDMNIEMKELIQERQALMEISYATGGIYTSVDSLDQLLVNIDIRPVQLMNNHKISGLSSHNYWWILILLLSIEWYFRKKLGLL